MPRPLLHQTAMGAFIRKARANAAERRVRKAKERKYFVVGGREFVRPLPRKVWTTLEVKKLKHMWCVEGLGISQIAAALKRTEGSVRGGINNYKLVRTEQTKNTAARAREYRRFYTAGEDEILTTLWRAGETPQRIALKLGSKTALSVYQRARVLKLPRRIYVSSTRVKK